MAGLLNTIFGGVMKALTALLGWMSPAGSLTVIAILIGLLTLYVFKLTSNQAAIGLAKRRMQGHLIEMRLYSDTLRVFLSAVGWLLLWNLRYLLGTLRPALVLGLPTALLLIQLDLHHGARPLLPHEESLLTVQLAPGQDVRRTAVELIAPPGVRVETPGVRSAATRRVSWRIRALTPGATTLEIRAGDTAAHKSVMVGAVGGPISRRRVRGLWEELLHPGEPRLEHPILQSIEVRYPGHEIRVLGTEVHWLTLVIIVSLVTVLLLRKRLAVQI